MDNHMHNYNLHINKFELYCIKQIGKKMVLRMALLKYESLVIPSIHPLGPMQHLKQEPGVQGNTSASHFP